MSLFKRKKIWWISFSTPKGERVRCSAKTTIKKEAQELHDKLRKDSWSRDQLGFDYSRTWDEAAIEWVETTKGTTSYYRNIHKINWLNTLLKGKYLVDIDRLIIYKVGSIKKSETSGANANRYLAVISAVLHRAYKWDWIPKVPSIERYSEPKKRIRWLTKVQYKKLLLTLPDYLKPMVQFSVATGLRQRNVKLLQWNQVDLERKVAWIHADDAKGGEAIGVPLNNDALNALQRTLGTDEKLVFTSKTGRVLNTPNNKDWRHALKRADITNFRWHDLRHTWASWHVQNGTPLYVLKELGGWKTLAMVEKYAHLAPEHLATYANNISVGSEKLSQS